MDKAKDRYSWMSEAMPGVAKLVVEKRRELGAGHVAECWRRGMAGEPGWFFAREGAIAIGTPWDDGDPVMREWAAAQITSTQALVVMRPKGAA